MLMSRSSRESGAVGPHWDPLSLEHRLPRDLVLVIYYMSVAPGSSPFRRIPTTDVKYNTKARKIQVKKPAVRGCFRQHEAPRSEDRGASCCASTASAGSAVYRPGGLLPALLDGLLQDQLLHLYGVSGLANTNPSQTVPFIKVFSLPASHQSPRLTTYSHRRSGKNAVRPGSRFHSYRASPHQTAFSLSGNGMITAFPVVASDAINLSIPDSLSISFALVSSNKWT